MCPSVTITRCHSREGFPQANMFEQVSNDGHQMSVAAETGAGGVPRSDV